MDIVLKPSSSEHIEKYVDLYKVCFPHALHLRTQYLSWLYYKNPAGKAIGADAWRGSKIIGQVLALPGQYFLHGEIVQGLLAVNVAVHPSCEGGHLFKKLGLSMCEYGAAAGYRFVIGVANKAATFGWLFLMGFQLVAPLKARVGIANLCLRKTSENIINATKLRHVWNENTITWRLSNPLKQSFLKIDKDKNWAIAYTSADKFGLYAVAEFPLNGSNIYGLHSSIASSLMPKVFLGLIPAYKFPNSYVTVPERFKPSPLNLIYKNLTDSKDRLDPSSCFINFLDFDAF
mgnify:CR=1 FL=1